MCKKQGVYYEKMHIFLDICVKIGGGDNKKTKKSIKIIATPGGWL